jgi:serine/threonine protein kinase
MHRDIRMASSGPDEHGFMAYDIAGTKFVVPMRWQPLAVQGKGSYGIVVAVYDHELKRNMAVKKVRGLFCNYTYTKRCLLELEVLYHVRGHPHLVGLHEVMEPHPDLPFDDLYFVIDLMQTDLRRTIDSVNVISAEHRRYFVYQILSAIKYLHSSGVAHRDVKPSNILLNTNCMLKLCDFNLAREMDSADESDTLTEYVVSRWYRAPEVILCSAKYTTKIDMWALGCIMIELQTRSAFFRGNDCLGQLNAIFKVRGTPSREDLLSCCVGNEDAAELVERLPHYDTIPISHVLPHCGKDEVDLIDQLLRMNPDKRLSVDEALQHPFLEKYIRVTPESKSPLDFTFPSNANKDPTVLREELTKVFVDLKNKCNATPIQYKSSKRKKKSEK